MSDVRSELESTIAGRGGDPYFDDHSRLERRSFDAQLLNEPVTVLSTSSPLIFSEQTSTTEAMRSMKADHRGCVLVTRDGTAGSVLTGIFTERDILLRIIDCGRNPAETPLAEVMSRDPEALQCDAPVAWVLNLMSVGGFRHVPIVNVNEAPAAVISVRDVVTYLVEAFPKEILNLPPDFGARQPHSRDGA